ncbi:MAG: ribonuclease P protein component [Anaerolineales bacterium]|nr:ribonuclease P protein component [Anaerolineales bacterium]
MKRGFSLRKSDDFKRVRRRGQSSAHPYLVLFWLPNEGHGLRIGISAGRNLGGAVQRNRAKRVLRAALQPLLGHIQPHHDLVIMARPGIQEAKSTQVHLVLLGLMRKAGLLTEA